MDKNIQTISDAEIKSHKLLQPLPLDLTPTNVEGKPLSRYLKRLLAINKVKDPEHVLKEKVEGKHVVLDNPIRNTLAQHQLNSPSRRAPISAKTRRQLQLFSIPSDASQRLNKFFHLQIPSNIIRFLISLSLYESK
jgi:hypothetical protein